jgi:hypothetical protein
MATTNPSRNAPAADRRVVTRAPRPWTRETKPSFMTTELWAALGGVAALIIVYNLADNASLDLWRTCLLATVLGTAYIVSRGFAKSGSNDLRSDTYDARYDDRL